MPKLVDHEAPLLMDSLLSGLHIPYDCVFQKACKYLQELRIEDVWPIICIIRGLHLPRNPKTSQKAESIFDRLWSVWEIPTLW